MITLQITKQIVIVDILKVRYVFKLIYLDDRIISLPVYEKNPADNVPFARLYLKTEIKLCPFSAHKTLV
jgi:hypothetical protein